jgi:hypothetical protein
MRASASFLASLPALAYTKGQPNPGTRETVVEVDRTFVAAARLEAGLRSRNSHASPAPRSARSASGSAANAAPRAPRECWCATRRW